MSLLPPFLPLFPQIERRESRREVKALRAAHINTVIENELLERLKQGTYEGVYNFPENAFNSVMDQEGEDDEEPSQHEKQKPEADVVRALLEMRIDEETRAMRLRSGNLDYVDGNDSVNCCRSLLRHS